MGGYNTIAEILAARVPALIVPREHPRLEQTIRAQRLARHTALRWCPAASCSPEVISSFVSGAISQPAGPLPAPTLSQRGLDVTAAEISSLLAARRALEPTHHDTDPPRAHASI